MPDYITVEEAAERLRVSPATVRRRAAAGDLGAAKVGRSWLVDAAFVPLATGRWVSALSRPSLGLDMGLARRHVASTDLNELWVPDVLRFRDSLAAPQQLEAEALRRILDGGPFNSPVEVEVPKSDYFTRPAVLLSIEDRVAFHAAVLSFASRIDRQLPEEVFSARLATGQSQFLRHGVSQWLRWRRAIAKTSAEGYGWMVKTDITAFFDNIQHRLLFSDIDSLNAEPAVTAALKRMIGEWSITPSVGLPQGPDAARVIANFYMLPVDQVMTGRPWKYLRYMDDIRILATSRSSAIQAIRELERECRRRGLVLSSQKTAIVTGDDIQADERDAELDAAHYLARAAGRASLPMLRRIFRRALGGAGQLQRRRAVFAMNRLREYGDEAVAKDLVDHLEELAPLARVVAQYLVRVIDHASVRTRISAFLADAERDTSVYLRSWVFAVMVEAADIPPEWAGVARDAARDRNRPSFERALAVQILARSGRRSDVGWMQEALRLEHDPQMMRALLVALFRGGELTKADTNRATGRFSELQLTVDYLSGRPSLPSLVYSAREVRVETASKTADV